MSDLRSNFLTRTVDWLRAGYPTGVPRQDYVALLGLLRRKLTETEVHKIAQDLASQSQASSDPISTGPPAPASIKEMRRKINARMMRSPSSGSAIMTLRRFSARMRTASISSTA